MERNYDYEQLWRFTKNVFTSIGCNEEHALLAATGLLRADLRGIDSHGIARLTGYVRLWEAKRANASPNLELVHETPSTGVVDGDGGFGLV
ncbi:MAG TPA: malate dehydrogenase, partial [Chitinophagaceae bacterium]|nr:malate dehydrogenase [Chitinophagaceae bacterium]